MKKMPCITFVAALCFLSLPDHCIAGGFLKRQRKQSLHCNCIIDQYWICSADLCVRDGCGRYRWVRGSSEISWTSESEADALWAATAETWAKLNADDIVLRIRGRYRRTTRHSNGTSFSCCYCRSHNPDDLDNARIQSLLRNKRVTYLRNCVLTAKNSNGDEQDFSSQGDSMRNCLDAGFDCDRNATAAARQQGYNRRVRYSQDRDCSKRVTQLP